MEIKKLFYNVLYDFDIANNNTITLITVVIESNNEKMITLYDYDVIYS